MPPTTEIHALLIADRERTVDLISSLSGNIASMVEAAQLTTSDDEHDPEGSTIAFERSQASTLLAAARNHLVDVDAALARIAAGSYGYCERCGGEVARDRLLARPTAHGPHLHRLRGRRIADTALSASRLTSLARGSVRDTGRQQCLAR